MADVELVRRMRDLAARGVPLSQAAGVGKALLDRSAEFRTTSALTERLTTALLDYNEAGAVAAWNEAFERLDLLSGFEAVVAPTLQRIGDAWHAGNVTVAQEHFASNFVRARLDSLNRQVVPFQSAPAVVLACVEGEHHEIGLLALSAALRVHGLRTIYLGADTPDADLLRVVEDTQPAVLALNAGSPEGAARLEAIIPSLAAAAPLTSIVFGGWVFDVEPARRDIPNATFGGTSLTEAVEIINRLSHQARRGGSR
jgi:methanogenic corrinoid protein MtbC1